MFRCLDVGYLHHLFWQQFVANFRQGVVLNSAGSIWQQLVAKTQDLNRQYTIVSYFADYVGKSRPLQGMLYLSHVTGDL